MLKEGKLNLIENAIQKIDDGVCNFCVPCVLLYIKSLILAYGVRVTRLFMRWPIFSVVSSIPHIYALMSMYVSNSSYFRCSFFTIFNDSLPKSMVSNWSQSFSSLKH